MPQVFLPQIQSVPRTGSEDEKFANLVKQINATFALLPWTTLLGLSDQSGSLQFTKSLSMGKQTISNLAQAVGDADAVPLSQVQTLIQAAVAAHLSSDDLATKVRLTEAEISTRATTAGNAEKLNGKQLLIGSVNIDIPLVTALMTTEFTIPVSGAVVADPCFVTSPPGIEAGLLWAAYVSAPNVVTVRLFNTTLLNINPAGPVVWTAMVLH